MHSTKINGMTSGGGNSKHPAIARRQIQCIWYFNLAFEILLANFEKFQCSGSHRKLSHDLFLTGVKNNLWFSRFFKHIAESFNSFFMKLVLISRSYRIRTIDIKVLITSSLVILETRLKVPILVIFDDFWRFASSSF